MNYNQALIVLKNNQHLVGTVIDNGFEVSEIIIVPSDEYLREDVFKRRWCANKDAAKSIMPFVNQELEVWCVNTKYFFKSNVLLYKVIGK